jgi:hypothetical protein
MAGSYDPTTDAEGLEAFKAFRLHVGCAACLSNSCETGEAVFRALQLANQRLLTPYHVRTESGEIRGAWDETTARFFVRRYGGAIVKSPEMERGSKMKITEIIAKVDNSWVSEDEDGRWLNIQGKTAGGLDKIYRIPEDAAHWFAACVADSMRQMPREDDEE